MPAPKEFGQNSPLADTFPIQVPPVGVPISWIGPLVFAQKECEETKYWLELLNATDYLSTSQLEPIYEQCIEVQKIVTKTIITTKQNRINSK